MLRKGIIYKSRYVFIVLFFFLFYNLGYWSGKKDGLLELHGINPETPSHTHTDESKKRRPSEDEDEEDNSDMFPEDKNEDEDRPVLNGFRKNPRSREPSRHSETETEMEIVNEATPNDANDNDNDNYNDNDNTNDNTNDNNIDDNEGKLSNIEEFDLEDTNKNQKSEIFDDTDLLEDTNNNVDDYLDPIEEVPTKPRKVYPPLPPGEKRKVYIVSHRRSGTHLTITTITNNFNNVEVLKQEDHPACDKESMGCERLEELMSSGKVVHAYRDVRDVLVSVYFYQEHIRKKNNKPPSNQTFSEFLVQMPWHPSTYRSMNRVEYWRHHYDTWMAVPGMLHLNFEDTVAKPEETLLRLEEYLEIPLKADRKPPEEWDKGHTVFFRKGQSGDWVNHFTQKDIEWVDREMSKPFRIQPLECTI